MDTQSEPTFVPEVHMPSQPYSHTLPEDSQMPNEKMSSTFGKPTAHLSTRIHSLLFWENTINSATVLFGSLGLLILTSYVSFLRLFFATATIAIGLNWVYVNGMIRGHKLFVGTDGVNPHRGFLTDSRPSVSREHIDRHVDNFIEIVNELLHEATNIVLIDDNTRSLRYFIGAYIAWTLATYIPANWLLGMGIFTSFFVPKLYALNKHSIDQRYKEWENMARHHIDRATTNVKMHSNTLLDKSRSFAAQHKIPMGVSKPGTGFKNDVPIVKKEE